MCLQELLREVLVIEARVSIRNRGIETESTSEPMHGRRWNRTCVHNVGIGRAGETDNDKTGIVEGWAVRSQAGALRWWIRSRFKSKAASLHDACSASVFSERRQEP